MGKHKFWTDEEKTELVTLFKGMREEHPDKTNKEIIQELAEVFDTSYGSASYQIYAMKAQEGSEPPKRKGKKQIKQKQDKPVCSLKQKVRCMRETLKELEEVRELYQETVELLRELRSPPRKEYSVDKDGVVRLNGGKEEQHGAV